MARRAHGANQDMESYRRSGRSAIQVQSHPRPYALPSHSQPPTHETSEDGAENSPRRRIALACQRCRKRKIKCSGDEGGKGCGNCKAAGQEPGACQFLRVNSTKCVVGDSGGGAWNISTADPLISNTAMDRAGVSVGSFHLLTGTGGPRSSFGQGQPQNQGPFNISNSFSTSPTRHPESYLNLSNHDPWDTTVQVPWHSNHDSMRSENSNYQVMNHSALSGPSVMEGPSPFVAIGSGRTLPCPSSLTNQARMLQPNSSIATNQGFWGESNTSNYPSYSPRSSQIEWGFRSNQVSTGSVSPSAIGTADRSNTRASTSDQVSKGNDIYGHLAPSAISPDTTLTRVPSGNLIESSNPAAATLLRLQPNTSFPTAQSNDASSEFSYTHSSYPPRGSLSRSDNPLGSEGTIGGFELYSPLPQLQPAFQATSRRPSNESLPAHRPATLMSSRA